MADPFLALQRQMEAALAKGDIQKAEAILAAMKAHVAEEQAEIADLEKV